MASYTLEFSDGHVEALVASSDNEAVREALARFDADAIVAEHWLSEDSDRGGFLERLMIWNCANDEDGDEAELTLVRRTLPVHG